MRAKTKALTLAICAVLLVVTTVFVTVAYLTSSDSVTNTFTVGKVIITLDETDVDLSGQKDGETRVKTNQYKLMPGHSYVKDPIVHVDANSEKCWVFVKVVNEIAAIEDAASTVADQMTANDWTAVSGAENVYAYKEIVNAGTDVKVFESFKISGSVEGSALEAYEGKTIVVTAYAVQADGFDSAAAAWTAAGFEWFPGGEFK